MGQSAGLLLGTAAAVVAGVVSGGNPLAIEAGFMIGSMVGTMLFPPKQPHPADVRVQDSAYGRWIPRFYGSYRAAGNVIWMGTPHNHNPGGKGAGGKGGNQPYVTISFAVGLCEGPIAGVRRIWANGKLIYDMSDPSNFKAISGSSQMFANFTVYLGDEAQNADPVMQSQLGVSNVPAYRGLAYVVFNEMSLQQWGNYMPSLSFEVVTPGTQVWSAFANVQTYTYPTSLGSMVQALNLSAQGAKVLSYGILSGYNGIAVGRATPYGTSLVRVNTPVIHPNVNAPWSRPRGYSDTPGLFAPTNNGFYAWWDEFGAPTVLTGFTPFTTDNYSTGDSLNKSGTDLFYTSLLGSTPNWPVIRIDMTTGLLAATSTITGGFVMIGSTASYVYVAASVGLTLYRLNRSDLSLAATFSFSGQGLSGVLNGYVVSDDNVYFWGGSSQAAQYTPSTNTLTVLGTGPSVVVTTMVVVNPRLIMFANASGSPSDTCTLSYMATGLNQGGVALSSIVSDLCTRAGLQSSQFDVSQLTDTVVGFGITGRSSTRDVLTPLLGTYFFDASDTDAKLKFVKRGRATAVTIPWADLGADANGPATQAAQNPLVETVMQEFELPRSETINYTSLSTDFQPGIQREIRGTTSSNLDEAVNVPIVMADNEAKVRVQTMLWERWTKKQHFKFSTQLKYFQYEPSDVVNVVDPTGYTYTLRITQVMYDGKGVCSFTADPSVAGIYPNFASYTAAGGQALGFTKQAVDYSGPTVLVPLDLPPLRNQDTSQGLYLAACGFDSTWQGCNVDVSRDDVNFSQLLGLKNRSAIGLATTALGNFSGGNIPDETNTVSVTLYDTSLTLSSVAFASFINGANPAMIGSELVYFRNATLVAAGQYTLSGLLRGQQGTEWAMGSHIANERFVFLDPTKAAAIGINVSDIGAPMYFEPFLANQFSVTDGDIVNVPPAVARVKPFSPWQFRAASGSAVSLSDITLTWIRRARVNSEWVDGSDVALDESAENYTLSIYNGATLKRTVAVAGPFTAPTTPSYVYTAANITADGFSAGNTITFTVQQNSDQGVLGYAATTTIVR